MTTLRPLLGLASLTLACAAGPASPENSIGTDPDETVAPEPRQPPPEVASEVPDPESIIADSAGSTTVGGDTSSGSSVGPQPEPAEPASDERPPLPKPVFGDTPKASCRKQLAVGETVKPFKLDSLDGKKSVSPSGYRGRVVLLNFWATWCKPCIKELPEFDRLYRKYRSSGFTLVAVATDEDAAAVGAVVEELKLAAKVGVAGDKAAAAYDHPNFPFSFVIDRSGKIVAAYDKVDEGCLPDLESVLRDQLEAE